MRKMGGKAMIGLIFALSGMLLLMLQIAFTDGWQLYRRVSQEVEEAFNHDTKIFPDHKYD